VTGIELHLDDAGVERLADAIARRLEGRRTGDTPGSTPTRPPPTSAPPSPGSAS